MAGLDYQVRDRSILLPWYKRRIVEPAVARFPSSLHPNTITHVGHLTNLLGLVVVLAFGSPRGGPAFAFAALTLHLYNFCDNADGAHARRTKQSSALGELLDHGLDLLNVAYIAALSARAIGASPFASVAMVCAITAAASATYWEQAETGVFELGLLNQVEATFLLAAVCLVSAFVGPEHLGSLGYGPVHLRDVLLVVTLVGSVAAMAGGALRVARRGGAIAPFGTLVLFGASVLFAHAVHALDTATASGVVAVGYVFLGIRNLTLRMRGRKPLLETGVLVMGLGIFGSTAISARFGVAQDGPRVFALVGTACLVVLSVVHASRGIRRVVELDRR